jgi:hypothetical protein
MSSKLAFIADFPNIKFKSGSKFAWSPVEQTVYYEKNKVDTKKGRFTLLHEISHALLNHTSFNSDLELMKLEVEAWQHARRLAKNYDLPQDDCYIDECLESYREWLYKRSMCAECLTNSLQDSKGIYNCHICGLRWSVPTSQLCKIQRRKIKSAN